MKQARRTLFFLVVLVQLIIFLPESNANELLCRTILSSTQKKDLSQKSLKYTLKLRPVAGQKLLLSPRSVNQVVDLKSFELDPFEQKIRHLILENGSSKDRIAERFYQVMTAEILESGVTHAKYWITTFAQNYGRYLKIQVEQERKGKKAEPEERPEFMTSEAFQRIYAEIESQSDLSKLKHVDLEKKAIGKALDEMTGQVQKLFSEKAKRFYVQFLEAYPKGASASDLKVFDAELIQMSRRSIEDIKTHFSLEKLKELSPKTYAEYEKSVENLMMRISAVDLVKFVFLPEVVFDKNENATIEFINKGIVAQFSHKMGTRVIRNKTMKDGLPLFYVNVAHGAGTDQSNAGSFKEVLPTLDTLLEYGISLAPDSENTGLGITNTDADPRLLAANAQVLAREVLELQRKELQHVFDKNPLAPPPPLLKIGRSLGSTTAQIHDFYYLGKNPYVLQFLGSFSNPFTIDEQIQHVREEVKVGIIKNADEPVLEYSKTVVEKFLADLQSASLSRKMAFNLSQILSVYVVSKSDEDGGKKVLQENQRWARNFTSLAHRWYIRDPIVETKYADQEHPGYNLWFPYLESKHHLINSRLNVDLDVAKRFFPDLPMELWPKARNQLISITGITLASMDFLIRLDEEVLSNVHSSDPLVIEVLTEIRKKAAGLKKYRDFLFHDKPRDERRFFSIVLKRSNMNLSQLQKVEWRRHFQTQERIRKEYIISGQSHPQLPSSTNLSLKDYVRMDLTARLAQVNFYFENSEMNRVKRELKNLGLIP